MDMNRLLDVHMNQKAISAYQQGISKKRTVFAMLFVRVVMFAALQSMLFLILSALHIQDAWLTAAAYWPLAVTVTNIACAILLHRLLQREGSCFFGFFAIEKRTFGRDLLLSSGLLLMTAVIGFLPSPLLGNMLFGNASAGNALLFQKVPLPAAIVFLLVFPLSMPFGELPTYYGYVMPRLEIITQSKAASIALPATMLSVQHAAMPLLFNLGGSFLLWRAIIFLPFAFALAFIIRWRPRLLPFLLIGHGLIDIGTAVMFFIPLP